MSKRKSGHYLLMSSGFAALEIILIIVVLIVVGSAGVYVFHKKHSSSNSSSNSSTNTPQKSTTTNTADTIPNTAIRPATCVNNPNATFTHDFTQPEDLKLIEPPIITAKDIRDRAWPAINTIKTTKIAIYAPADIDLTSGIYKVSSDVNTIDYDLWFQLSCTRWFFINHVSEPVDKIRKLLPSSPKNLNQPGVSNTADQPTFNPAVHFKSGELIGYTTGTSLAHNFDLGVFDINHVNSLPAAANGANSERSKWFICPFDLFPSTIKAQYYAILHSSPLEAGSVCPQ